jgi:hypothetical protein
MMGEEAFMKYLDLFVVTTLILPLAACPKDEEGGDENAEADADVDADADETATSTEGETSADGSTDVSTSEDGPDTVDGSTGEDATTEAETTVSETTDAETTDAETTADETTEGGPLQWWESCGDPVCQGYDGPWPTVPPCNDIQAGDPCSTEGQTCDFMSDCNAVLVCATEDPKMQEGGCPISRAEFKQDIAYLDASQRDAFYQQVLDMRMATWRYRERSDQKQHLGVILEDGEDQVWADPAHDRVDLYSYGSLAIVGVQQQADELAELRAAVSALQSEVVELREQAERCK